MPRHASTVVVVRERPGALEVFCVRRHVRSGFLGGAVVFPGGKVDPSDEAEIWSSLTSEPAARTDEMTAVFDPAAPSVTARALVIAACRESLEEARILPLDTPVGDAVVEELRLELQAAPDAFATVLRQRGLRLALDALVPWGRWVTPNAEMHRYDARFFLLELPAGQEGCHDDHETTMSFWDAPSAVLDRSARGEIFLAPPTTRTLELLEAVRDARDARALAAEQSLLPVCPTFIPGDVPLLALPGDPAHAVPERRVSGPTRFALREGRFVSEDPPAGGEGMGA